MQWQSHYSTFVLHWLNSASFIFTATPNKVPLNLWNYLLLSLLNASHLLHLCPKSGSPSIPIFVASDRVLYLAVLHKQPAKPTNKCSLFSHTQLVRTSAVSSQNHFNFRKTERTSARRLRATNRHPLNQVRRHRVPSPRRSALKLVTHPPTSPTTSPPLLRWWFPPRPHLEAGSTWWLLKKQGSPQTALTPAPPFVLSLSLRVRQHPSPLPSHWQLSGAAFRALTAVRKIGCDRKESLQGIATLDLVCLFLFG